MTPLCWYFTLNFTLSVDKKVVVVVELFYMENKENQTREPIIVHGQGSVRTRNEMMYYGSIKKIDDGIYESVSFVRDNETGVVTRLTTWTKGEGEDIEVIEMEGEAMRKEKLGVGEFVKNEGGSEDTFKLVLKVSPAN